MLRSEVREVVVDAISPSLLLLMFREFGSSKSGAGVLSGGTEDDEEDKSAALAIVLLLLLLPVVKNAHAVEATANAFALLR